VNTIRTTCPYCGVGCGVEARVKNDRIIGVSGDEHHPANSGRLCVKGTSLVDTQSDEGRLLYPQVDGQRTAWDSATRHVAERFQQTVDQFGPDSIAFYLSGQLLTEDYYVANKLMKGFIGSSNVDTNSRLCMSSAVAAYKRAFGEDVVPCNYEDIETADLLVLVGSNAAWAHPVIYQKIVAAVADRGAKVVVIDPRRTATCDVATSHLAINPGTDTTLFNGLLRYIKGHGQLDREYIEAHTSGFSEALQAAGDSVQQVAEKTGLQQDQVRGFYEMFCQTRRVITLYSQGVNQSADGTDKCNAIINCHLATGRVGKPGAGPFSLTGQPNAMGGREVGGMANQLAAHLGFGDLDRDLLQRFWNAPRLVSGPGAMAVDMFEQIAVGKIRAIWIMATNPVVSLPGSGEVAKALRNCPFVVVSDVSATTDTTQYADVLLPACGWGEKDGTVTNSERCISRQRALVSPPGEARPDWQIICDVASHMGYGQAFGFQSSHQIFCEHARLSGFENDGGRLFDISSVADLDKSAFDTMAPFHWPADGQPFKAGQYQTDDRRARFIPIHLRDLAATGQYILNTGRIRDQWHTMTRTGVAEKLFKHQSQPWLEMALEDSAALSVETGDLVAVSSAVGSALLPVRVASAMQPGQVFLPMHWNFQFASSGSVNHLVAPLTDPISGQPELKLTSVEITRADVVRWLQISSAMRLPPTLLDHTNMSFWSLGRSELGFVHNIALSPTIALKDNTHLQDNASLTENTVEQVVEELQRIYNTNRRVSFVDSISNCVRVRGFRGNTLEWTVLTTERLGQDAIPVQPDNADWRALSMLALSDEAISPRVCTCFEVSSLSIRNAYLQGAHTTEDLSKALKCGTNCGSCLPEINRIVKALDGEIKQAAGASL
jgi:assimilatory nitrate reductase catalytic subunit